MFVLVCWVWAVMPCEPAKLILRNGTTIWTECGWQRLEKCVVLKFRDFHFRMDEKRVDWRGTMAPEILPAPVEVERKPPKRNDWDAFVRQTKPEKPGKALILTNKSLARASKRVGRKIPKKVAQNPKTTKRKGDLEQALTQLRRQRQQLRAQLQAEVTWRQAQHLLEQIDFLEQRIREKQYWLSRRKREQKKTAETKTKPQVPNSKPQSRLSILADIEKRRMISKNRATLIPCYTCLKQGDPNGQLNHHHRGSRA